jgi:hypothetical protein
MDCSAEAVCKAEKRVRTALTDSLPDQEVTENYRLEMCASAGGLQAQILHESITDKVTDPGSSRTPGCIFSPCCFQYLKQTTLPVQAWVSCPSLNDSIPGMQSLGVLCRALTWR